MANRIRVLIAASEVRPLAQTGGLADVTGSLPSAFEELGLNSAVIMPAYQSTLKTFTFEDLDIPISVDIGGEQVKGSLLGGRLPSGVKTYLVKCDRYFDRPGLYGEGGGEYIDNPERFAFFSKAVVQLIPKLQPDIILANDWQTGLIMPLLNQMGPGAPKGVFVIHNQGYLGLVPGNRTGVLGLPDFYYGVDGLEYYGQMSLLKAGIVFSQAVVTVSPSYAKEIQTPEGGHGLDGVLRQVAGKLHGILNGVDYTVWNPQTDPMIAAHYTMDDLSGKAACKADLLQHINLPKAANAPLFGMVSRLTSQKGIMLITEAADEMFRLGLGLVILGTGEAWHENILKDMAARYPDNFSLILEYDVAMSHKIIAGCDFILVPSLYEPCGLVQLYALKYGSIPIVRAVGGLNDTVRDFAGQNPTGEWDNGFKFTQFQSPVFYRAVKRAVDLYNHQDNFQSMVKVGMKEDFSWKKSAEAYAGLFKQLLN